VRKIGGAGYDRVLKRCLGRGEEKRRKGYPEMVNWKLLCAVWREFSGIGIGIIGIDWDSWVRPSFG
jgi:hypothetical protein